MQDFGEAFRPVDRFLENHLAFTIPDVGDARLVGSHADPANDDEGAHLAASKRFNNSSSSKFSPDIALDDHLSRKILSTLCAMMLLISCMGKSLH